MKKFPKKEVDISSIPFDVRDEAIKRTEREMHPILTKLHISVDWFNISIFMILITSPIYFLFSIADSFILRIFASIIIFLWMGVVLHYMINVRDKKRSEVLERHLKSVEREQAGGYR